MAREAVLELAEGLYALSSDVALDGRVSWVPPGTTGWEPVTSYLLRSGGESLLIDTGVACQRDVLLRQLAAVLGPNERPTVLLTRIEFDALGNLDAVAREFHAERVITASLNPTDFLGALDAVASVGTTSLQFERLRPGSTVTVGTRRLALLQGPIFTLGTLWVHDPVAAVLFTSDAFGHLHLPPGDGDAGRIVDDPALAGGPEDVAAQLDAKFDWLRRAEVGALAAGLDTIFAEREICLLAPGRGCILRGRSLVEGQYRLLRQALTRGRSA